MQADSITYFPSDSLSLVDSLQVLESNNVKKELSSFIKKDSANLEYNPILQEPGKDMLSILFLISFTLLAILNFQFRKRFRDLFKAFWARNYSNQLIREGNIFQERFGLGVFLYYLIAIPLFIIFSANHIIPGLEKPVSLTAIFEAIGIILSVWAFRLIFIKLTAIVFNTPKSSAEVTTQLFIFNMVSAVVVLPFICTYYFSEQIIFLYAAISLWFIIQFYRFIRLFVIGFSYAIFSGLHLFLYLCTLEIIPIVVLLKILSKIYL